MPIEDGAGTAKDLSGEGKVGRLAGSSGTPGGFNDALEKIKAQASD